MTEEYVHGGGRQVGHGRPVVARRLFVPHRTKYRVLRMYYNSQM